VGDTSAINALTRTLNALAQLSSGNTARRSKSRTGADAQKQNMRFIAICRVFSSIINEIYIATYRC
jgi:hypothetical protein